MSLGLRLNLSPISPSFFSDSLSTIPQSPPFFLHSSPFKISRQNLLNQLAVNVLTSKDEENQLIKTPQRLLSTPPFSSRSSLFIQSNSSRTSPLKTLTLDFKKSELPSQHPSPSQIVSSKTGVIYQLLEKIGAGSFSTVYKAHARGRKLIEEAPEETCEYAIKISALEDNERETLENKKNQQAEEEVLQKLNNEEGLPIIQHIEGFDYGQQRITVYPLLAKNLHEACQHKDIKGLKHIKEIALRILKGTAHLVSLSVIHCDLKPENILIESCGPTSLKIADFGLAQDMHAAKKKLVIQTSYYRAPEVAMELPYNEKVDIWSIGCTLAELYTGKPLFKEFNKDWKTENHKVLLAIVSVIGPIPHVLLKQSRCDFVSDPVFYEKNTPPQTPLSQILFNTQDLQSLSEKKRYFLDLIQKMLKLHPHERISAKGALRHPFFTHSPSPSSPSSAQLSASSSSSSSSSSSTKKKEDLLTMDPHYSTSPPALVDFSALLPLSPSGTSLPRPNPSPISSPVFDSPPKQAALRNQEQMIQVFGYIRKRKAPQDPVFNMTHETTKKRKGLPAYLYD